MVRQRAVSHPDDPNSYDPFTGLPWGQIPTTGTGILPNPNGARPASSPAQQQAITTHAMGQRLPAIWCGTEYPIRTGGLIVYENINSGVFIVVMLVCHGPIGAMTFTIDGKTPGNLGFANGLPNTQGGYEQFLGTSNQTASTILSNYVPNWQSTLPGIAYVVLAFSPQGPAPSYTSFLATITQGLLVRDPRNGVDGNGIPNTARVTSSNPGLIWADARTSRRYGAGDSDSSIDWTGDVEQVANDCDFNIGGGVKRYVMGYKCDNSGRLDPESVTQAICKHAAMVECRYNGKWHLWVDKAQNSNGTLFADQPPGITGSPNGNVVNGTFREKGQSEVYNRVRVHFVDPTKNYVDNSAEYADPGVDAGTKEDTLAEYTLGVPAAQAKRLAQQYQKRSAKVREYTLVAGPEGTLMTPGARFSAVSNQWGNNVTKDLIPTAVQCMGSTWAIKAEEYDATIYPA